MNKKQLISIVVVLALGAGLTFLALKNKGGHGQDHDEHGHDHVVGHHVDGVLPGAVGEGAAVGDGVECFADGHHRVGEEVEEGVVVHRPTVFAERSTL